MTDNPLKRTVRLYYLGGLTEGDSSENLFVQSRGKALRVPKVGDFIEVPLYNANDLISRGHNGLHSCWSLSANDAERAKNGTLHPEVFRNPAEMSVEELEALLAERRAEQSPKEPKTLDIEKLKEIAVVDDDEDEEGDPEPDPTPDEPQAEQNETPDEGEGEKEEKPKRRGRPRKNSSNNEKEDE